ncbi:unnamed protein product [Microthlaspi erraticum]|uniref:SKP1-like protein n=1 Tax=Microthlaspi erraticum TaxID=1685480 RepID=A0A6D2K253_9BRAS|nr:unnamed protein product [Microthlaspi erraticum]
MSTSAKKIVFKSSDNKIFEVDEAVARQCKTIAHMIEEVCVDDAVPLANVTGKILAKVLEFCKKHLPAVVPDADAGAVPDPFPSSVEELREWDDDFINEMDQSMLMDVCQAADFLNVPKLLDLACKAVNDFTAEEEGI